MTGEMQAVNVIKSWAEGSIGFEKMVAVLKSMAWAKPVHSTDWMEVADVPVTVGPNLIAALSLAQIQQHITSTQFAEIYEAVAP